MYFLCGNHFKIDFDIYYMCVCLCLKWIPQTRLFDRFLLTEILKDTSFRSFLIYCHIDMFRHCNFGGRTGSMCLSCWGKRLVFSPFFPLFVPFQFWIISRTIDFQLNLRAQCRERTKTNEKITTNFGMQTTTTTTIVRNKTKEHQQSIRKTIKNRKINEQEKLFILNVVFLFIFGLNFCFGFFLSSCNNRSKLARVVYFCRERLALSF